MSDNNKEFAIVWLTSHITLVGEIEKENKTNIHLRQPCLLSAQYYKEHNTADIELIPLLEPTITEDRVVIIEKKDMLFQVMTPTKAIVDNYRQCVIQYM